MEGFLTFIGAIIVVFAIIWGAMSASEKYFGTQFTTKSQYSKALESNSINQNIALRQHANLIKTNPKLYHKAIENLTNKKYAKTYSNLNREIEKIKKQHPEWVENEAKKQASINQKKALIEQEKNKAIIIESEKRSKELKAFINNPKYQSFLALTKKLNQHKQLTPKEEELYNSEPYKEYKQLYDSYSSSLTIEPLLDYPFF